MATGRLRDDHGDRWGSRTNLLRYRGTSKTYDVAEVRDLLRLGNPRAAAVGLPPTDRALREWPVLAFYLPWRGRATWAKTTLRDLVRFLYSCTRDVIETFSVTPLKDSLAFTTTF